MKRSRIIAGVAVVIAIAALVAFYAPLRLRALVLVGRSPQCSFDRAVEVSHHAKALEQAHNRFVASMRLLNSDPAGFDQWQTSRGTYWIPKGDRYVLPFNLAEEELSIYGTGEQDVKAGDTVLDCGANVGVFTRRALDRGAAKVIAIEPSPENVEVLRRNFRDEIVAGRVVVYAKGVWDKDDVLVMHVDANNTAANTFVIDRKQASGEVRLPLTTIDKLAAELELERVDYIKMDIEGAETNALSGARQTLARFHPRLSISAYHLPTDPVRIPQIVRAADTRYRVECGPCEESGMRIRPAVLYFR